MTVDASDALGRLLSDDEALKWRGKPHRGRLLLAFGPILIPVVVVVGAFGMVVGFVGVLAVELLAVESAVLSPTAALGVVVIIGLATVGGLLAVGLRRYHQAEYAATDRRLVAFGGIVGRDSSSVAWDDVRDVEVSVGALDGLLNTGTIHAVTNGRGGVVLPYVSRPYERASDLDELHREARR